MWSDNEADFDLLDVRHLVAAVTTTVTDERLLPLTLGVYGAWGSGKSSVIRMSRAVLEQDESILCVSFNGWQFEGYEDAKAALMGTVLDAILGRRTLSQKAVDLGKKLLRRVDWFRLLGWAGKSVVTLTTGLPAFGVGALVDATRDALGAVPKKLEGMDVEEVKKLLEEAPDGEDVRQPVREFRDDFAELIRETGLRCVVVFIDDLDRCTPPTMIETLEAIKLFLFVDRTAFVIGADEDLVRHAVRERFPEIRGSAVDVSTSYLEKLIQVPLRVPPLGRAEMESYMNLLFAELHLGAGKTREILGGLPARAPESLGTVSFTYDTVRTALGEEHPSLGEDLAMVSQVADILTAGLKGNPRQTKRFLNALLLRMRMAEARGIALKRRVLAKLMLLEYLHTEAFVQVGDWQAAKQGIAEPLAEVERRVRAAAAEGAPEPPVITLQSELLAGQQASRPASREGGRLAEGEAAGLKDVARWTEHEWLRRWLQIDPPLGEEDLRPYYFFSRDHVTVSAGALSRMTPEARRVLVELESESDVRRAGALREVEGLSPADAAAIYEVLREKTVRSEDLRGSQSPLMLLLRVAEKRPELIAQAVTLLARLEEGRLGGGVVPVLSGLVRNTPSEAAGRELLTRWTRSQNDGLRAAAEAALTPREGRRKGPGRH
jgi:hypothetical protein